MRKLLLPLLLAVNMFAAGTVTQVGPTWLGNGMYKVVISATGDASTGSYPTAVLSRSSSDLGNTDGFSITGITTDPGSTAPTDNWDLTLVDSNALDLMQGACLNRDTSTSESCSANPTPLSGNATITITGNSVNSATITITVYLTNQTVAKRLGGGAPGGAAGGDLSGTYPNPTVAALNGVAASNYVRGAASLVTDNSIVVVSAVDGVLMEPAIPVSITSTGMGVGGAATSILTLGGASPRITIGAGNLFIASGGDIIFEPAGAGAETARLKSTGEFGLGFTAPPNKLSVLGVAGIYGGWNDASNYFGGTITSTDGALTIAAVTAGTGSDNQNVAFVSAGNGYVSASTGIVGAGAIPAVGTCGTIGTGSKNAAGFITSTVTGACVSVLTFAAVAAPVGWSCAITNATTANLITQTGSSTTTATFTGTTVTGDVLRYACSGY